MTPPENLFKSFCKSYWFATLLCLSCFGFAFYMAWTELRTEKMLVDESLKGNRYAIAMLVTHEKPWKLNKRLISEALQGNLYALETLKIKLEEKE